MVIMQSAASSADSGSYSCDGCTHTHTQLHNVPHSVQCTTLCPSALQWLQYFSTMARHNYRPELTTVFPFFIACILNTSTVCLSVCLPGLTVRIAPKKPTIFGCIGIISESIRRCLSFGELMITFVAGSAAWSSNPLMQTQAKFSVPVPASIPGLPFSLLPWVTETRSVALSPDWTGLNWSWVWSHERKL